jgi:hypothetical protein
MTRFVTNSVLLPTGEISKRTFVSIHLSRLRAFQADPSHTTWRLTSLRITGLRGRAHRLSVPQSSSERDPRDHPADSRPRRSLIARRSLNQEIRPEHSPRKLLELVIVFDEKSDERVLWRFSALGGSKTVRYGRPCRTRGARRVFHDPGRLLIPNVGSEDLKFLLAAEKQLKESLAPARGGSNGVPSGLHEAAVVIDRDRGRGLVTRE